MNAQACAASGDRTQWGSIDFTKCHWRIRRLQARIVKAQLEGKPGRVKALQWILTHSFSAKVLAVKRVAGNRGAKTAGVDGEIWRSTAAKSKAILSLGKRGYKALPLRRVYILKSNGKMRPLGIPTMKDRAMQALYLMALEPIAETTADRNSYGFRPMRSTADAIGQCFNVLARKKSAVWVLEGDIKGCFDNIGHDWLMEHIPMDKSTLKKWLKAGFMEGKTLFPTGEGTPQGGIISPALANMALDGLERELKKRFRRQNKVNMVRYADDFIITGKSKDVLENEVKPCVEAFLQARNLELSPDKTRITHIEDGFDFLGQNVRKYNGKLLIKPSKRNVKAFLDKVRKIIKGNKTARQLSLIMKLNPVIRGWANYHRHVVSKETFNSVDKMLWRMVWQWAKGRHPKKDSRWIKGKYFKTEGSRNWVFAVEETMSDKKGNVRRLTEVTDIPIRRHVKIKAEVNPFDQEWETYCHDRTTL
jgi:RNA-directed DNA polymerase